MEGRNKAKDERKENWLVFSHPGSPRWSSCGNVCSAEKCRAGARRGDLAPVQDEFPSPLMTTAPFASGRLSSVPLGEPGTPLRRLGVSVTLPEPTKNPQFGIH